MSLAARPDREQLARASRPIRCCGSGDQYNARWPGAVLQTMGSLLPAGPVSASLQGASCRGAAPLEGCAAQSLPILTQRGVPPASWGWCQMNPGSADPQRTQGQALHQCEAQLFSSVKVVLRTPSLLSRWGGLTRYMVSLNDGKNYW